MTLNLHNIFNDSKDSKSILSLELLKSLYEVNERLLSILGSYDGILDFKSIIIDGAGVDYIEELIDGKDILNDTEKGLVKKYIIELTDSAVYGSPVNETIEQKEKLILGEQLFNVVNNVNKILINK